MRNDPQLRCWLQRERWHFVLFHGGSFVPAAIVGLLLVAMVAASFGLFGYWRPSWGYTRYGAGRGIVAILAITGAWWVMLWRWGRWLRRDGVPLLRLDLDRGTRVLHALVNAEGGVPIAQLARGVGRDTVERLAHLRGIVRLSGPPESLSLDGALRRKLAFAAPERFEWAGRLR